MIQFTTALKQEVGSSLSAIEKMDADTLKKAAEITALLKDAFNRLRFFIHDYQFRDEAEEILFFKEIKPKLFCDLVFYQKMYNLEVHRPAGRSLELKTYLKKELFRITDFFEKNEAFYCYYRSKGTAMDRQYFLRGKTDHTLYHGCLSHERDPLFSTAADLKMTRILANDKLEKYIYGELARTDELTLGLAKNNYPKSKLSWTGSKSDLVELTYALIEAGVFNHGRTTLKEVSAYFENVFNVDLGGNPSRTFLELCIRKSRTAFLDKLRSVLILKMDREEKMEHKMS